MFRKITVISLSLFLFILFNAQVYAKTMESKITDNPSKDWTINFNQAIDKKSVTKGSVYIKTVNGTLPALLSISDNLKQISVKPEKKYEIGVNYQLVINQEVTSNKGSKLKEDIIMDFLYKGIHISNIEALLNPFTTNIKIKTSPTVIKANVSVNGSAYQSMFKTDVSQFSKGMIGLTVGDQLVIRVYDVNDRFLEEQTYSIKNNTGVIK